MRTVIPIDLSRFHAVLLDLDGTVYHDDHRLPGAVDGFELAVRAILGQQVSQLAAARIAARVVDTFGEPIETPVPGLTKLFPTPEAIAALEPAKIAPCGVISVRARAIGALANRV